MNTPVAVPMVVILVVSDPAERRRWFAWLGGIGIRVRVATRAAEIAKALADRAPRVVLRSAHAMDVLLTADVALPVLELRPFDPGAAEALRQRLDAAGGQPTSSA